MQAVHISEMVVFDILCDDLPASALCWVLALSSRGIARRQSPHAPVQRRGDYKPLWTQRRDAGAPGQLKAYWLAHA